MLRFEVADNAELQSSALSRPLKSRTPIQVRLLSEWSKGERAIGAGTNPIKIRSFICAPLQLSPMNGYRFHTSLESP